MAKGAKAKKSTGDAAVESTGSPVKNFVVDGSAAEREFLVRRLGVEGHAELSRYTNSLREGLRGEDVFSSAAVNAVAAATGRDIDLRNAVVDLCRAAFVQGHRVGTGSFKADNAADTARRNQVSQMAASRRLASAIREAYDATDASLPQGERIKSVMKTANCSRAAVYKHLAGLLSR